VPTLVSDAAQPRPATAPVPDQATGQTAQAAATQAESPSQAVTPAATDTGVRSETPREGRVDVTV
jgi:hypothetical protein